MVFVLFEIPVDQCYIITCQRIYLKNDALGITYMRKIIVFNMISVDGFFAGADGDISWHNVDGEFNDFAIAQLGEVGALMFGRVTYELMASYWSGARAVKNDPIVAGLMNNTPKIVFSKTLRKAEWNNTKITQGIGKLDIEKLKQEPGKDLFIFGSGNIVGELSGLRLIDEYRLMVNPVILGQGKPMFKDWRQRQKLKLSNSKQFKSGNVLLYYETVK